MEKKTSAKPMREILSHLFTTARDHASSGGLAIEVIFFNPHILFNVPVEEWPMVDCLLAWFSNGFPLAKVRSVACLLACLIS
jgi:inositol-hexakisphosphate/diphosphoinositol-pentakisphosphate 1-kinase